MDDSFEYMDEESLNLLLSRFEDMISSGKSVFFDIDEIDQIIDKYLEKSDLKKAIKGLELAMDIYPNSDLILLKKAVIEMSSVKYEEALETLDKVEAMQPNNPDVYIVRSTVLSAQDKHFQAVIELKKSLLYTDEKSEVLSMIGYEYEMLSDYKTATEFFIKSYYEDRTNDSTLYEIVHCYVEEEDFDKCIKFLDEIIDRDPYSKIAWYNLGIIYYNLDLYEKSIDAYDYAIVIDESFSSAHYNKANTYIKTEQYEKAIESFNECILHENETHLTNYHIGECYERLGDFKKAENYYRKSLLINANFSTAYVGLGSVSEENGKFHNARFYYEKAAAMNTSSATNLSILADFYARNDFLNEAITSYNASLNLDSSDVDAWIELSEVYMKNDDKDKAIEILNDALLVIEDKTKSELYYKMTAYCLANNNVEKAVVALEEALQTDKEGLELLLTEYPHIQEVPEIKATIELFRDK